MRHETPCSGGKIDDLVGEQVRLYRRDPEALDAIDAVERPEQIQKRLAGIASELTDIDTSDHDLPAPFRCHLTRLGGKIGNASGTAASACRRNCAIRAPVVASVLHFKEISRAVAFRA